MSYKYITYEGKFKINLENLLKERKEIILQENNFWKDLLNNNFIIEKHYENFNEKNAVLLRSSLIIKSNKRDEKLEILFEETKGQIKIKKILFKNLSKNSVNYLYSINNIRFMKIMHKLFNILTQYYDKVLLKKKNKIINDLRKEFNKIKRLVNNE